MVYMLSPNLDVFDLVSFYLLRLNTLNVTETCHGPGAKLDKFGAQDLHKPRHELANFMR